MIEIIDPTRLRDSLQCLRLYYWRHERGYVPVKPRLPLPYGSGVHATLASWYRGSTAGQALLEFEKVWAEMVLPFVDEMDEEDPKRNPVRWMDTFVLYRQFYKDKDTAFEVLILPDGRPAVEIPFFLPLTDKIALGGIIDLIIKYLMQIMIVDHKTTSYLNSKWIAGFNPNHQFTSYILAANELLKPEFPISTLLVNALLTHATENRPERLFDRIPTVRNQWDLDDLKETLIGHWTDTVMPNRRTGIWPKNDDRCERWPGGCEYKPLCTEVQANHRKLIPSKSLYREDVWDPVQDLRRHGLEITV